MSPEKRPRFWENDMHENKDLKRDALQSSRLWSVTKLTCWRHGRFMWLR